MSPIDASWPTLFVLQPRACTREPASEGLSDVTSCVPSQDGLKQRTPLAAAPSLGLAPDQTCDGTESGPETGTL